MFYILILAISNSAYSQGTWGVEAGVNFANLKGDDIPDESESRSGLLLAVSYMHALENAPIILQPELIYSQKGLELRDDYVIKLNYLVAAGLAKFYFEVSDQIIPFVKAGPYVGFNITAKQEFDDNEEDLDEIQRIDAGVIIRAGLQIDRFEFGARFSRGLTDVFDDGDGKNSVLGLFVGVTL